LSGLGIRRLVACIEKELLSEGFLTRRRVLETKYSGTQRKYDGVQQLRHKNCAKFWVYFGGLHSDEHDTSITRFTVSVGPDS